MEMSAELLAINNAFLGPAASISHEQKCIKVETHNAEGEETEDVEVRIPLTKPCIASGYHSRL
jgi:hypothetical protein